MNSSAANGFWARKQLTDSSSIEAWMQNRKKKLLQHQTSLTHLASSAFSDSTPDITKTKDDRITLDELSDLYRRAGSDPDPDVDAAIPPAVGDEHRLVTSPSSSTTTTSGVRLRLKGDGGVGGGGGSGRKIINRLSCEFNWIADLFCSLCLRN